jgi:hypothetical protein
MNTWIQQDCCAYCDYAIWLRSYELPVGGWVPRALALLPRAEGGGEEEVVTPGARPWRSCEEADAYAGALSQHGMEQHMALHEGTLHDPDHRSVPLRSS